MTEKCSKEIKFNSSRSTPPLNVKKNIKQFLQMICTHFNTPLIYIMI